LWRHRSTWRSDRSKAGIYDRSEPSELVFACGRNDAIGLAPHSKLDRL